MNFCDIPAEKREALYELGRDAGYGAGLVAAAEAVQAAGGDTRAILDLIHARQLSTFVLRNESLAAGAPR